MINTPVNGIFTSESVSRGHPDKVADQISDGLLDAYLEKDPDSRVAIETLVTTGHKVVIAGEVKSNTEVDHEVVVKRIVQNIGYDQDQFSYQHLDIENLIHQQSNHIAQGVDTGGAGDQGIMFGYATNHTPNFMPLPIQIAHDILKELDSMRTHQNLPLGPDAKSQVTVNYKEGQVVEIKEILVSHQHQDNVSQTTLKDMIQTALETVLKPYNFETNYQLLVNPTGQFVIGGPHGDTGLTGRKIIVDTYGGAACHGGGAFSGKDPTKVDRSAAYVARWLAKNIVATGFVNHCQIQLSYAIGVIEPRSISVKTEDSTKSRHLESIIHELDVDLTPNGIINQFQLKAPIYLPTASYGHFGKTASEGFYNWEKLDLVDQIKAYL